MSEFFDYIKTSYEFDADRYASDPHWSLLEQLYTRNWLGEQDSVERIPKKIHQIWVGSKIPDLYVEWGKSFKEIHPDWEYKLWTDEDVASIPEVNLKIWTLLHNPGAKSDYLRYILLNKYGGFYFDTDFRLLKSIESFCRFRFIIGVGYPAWPEFYNGFFGSVPNNVILQEMITSIETEVTTTAFQTKRIFEITGTYKFTTVFFRVIKNYQKSVVALPPIYLYPFPNDKRHQNRDGDVDIKPESFAIHYWETAWGPTRYDYIRGERFHDLTDFVYTPRNVSTEDYLKYLNTFDPSELKEITSVYTSSIYVKQLFEVIKHFPNKKFVVVSHNADTNIDESYEIPENVIRWFAQNVNYEHPKLESIPIGLENAMWEKRTNKFRYMQEVAKKSKGVMNIAYLNCDPKTNPERLHVYTVLERAAWCTKRQGKNGYQVDLYFNELYNHKFAICPDGNGIDTVRLWESLYLGTYPVVKRSINTMFYQDLPICYVDKWEDVTLEFLNSEYDRLSKGTWNWDKLNFRYWIKRINSYGK